MRKLELSKLNKEQLKALPSWMTTPKAKRSPFQKYLYFVYDQIVHFTTEDRTNAVKAYAAAKAKSPKWERCFNEFFTDEMIELGYNKKPSDVEKTSGLTYREVINAFYYKAYPENHDKLDQLQKKLIRQVLLKEERKNF